VNQDPDIQPVVDTTGWPPMQLERPGRLQTDCKRLEPFATESEMAPLQAIFEQDSYAMLDLEQRLLLNELEGRAGGR
jgi:hypothetical protein